MPSSVLVSWIAVNNDPFERDRAGGAYRLVGGKPVAGPTFTLLFDSDSPYAGNISDFVLFHGGQSAGEDSRQARAVSETLKELKARDPRLRVHLEPWDGDDPTDHGQILDFLRQKLPEIRRKFSGKELVVHVEPGNAVDADSPGIDGRDRFHRPSHPPTVSVSRPVACQSKRGMSGYSAWTPTLNEV